MSTSTVFPCSALNHWNISSPGTYFNETLNDLSRSSSSYILCPLWKDLHQCSVIVEKITKQETLHYARESRERERESTLHDLIKQHQEVQRSVMSPSLRCRLRLRDGRYTGERLFALKSQSDASFFFDKSIASIQCIPPTRVDRGFFLTRTIQ